KQFSGPDGARSASSGADLDDRFSRRFRLRRVGLTRVRMMGCGLRFRSAGLLLGVVMVASCVASSDPAAGISNQPMSGKIGGRPWTAMTGKTFVARTKVYVVYIFGTAFSPCTNGLPLEMDEVVLQVPDTVGSYDLDLTLAQSIIVGSIGQTLLTW